ncbi:lysophospholipid acyltransferase family protein [Falsiroseomonas sp. CW058]|uniref:lysophospholipid acyltransferase family protein n=1 Tax=Falsiroseomonas sp. CW058 TaxID=3388664 RepID=UPI003D31FAB8
MRRLIRHPAVQAGLARLLGGYLAFVIRTTRWTLGGEGTDAAVRELEAGRPLIVAFWHERLPLVPPLRDLAAARTARASALTPRVLVSRHRDGRFIGNVMHRFGARMIYGSSRRGGAPAMIEMLRALREGDPVLITPDGPRGPRRRAAAGVAQLAAMSGAVVVPLGAASTRHRILPSWDRMMLPLPFGRAVLVCGAPVAVPRDGADAALPAIAAGITAATDAADAALGIVPANGG